MKKVKLKKSKGPFIFTCGNGKQRRFRNQELFSEAWKAISEGRYKNNLEIWNVISKMPNGYVS